MTPGVLWRVGQKLFHLKTLGGGDGFPRWSTHMLIGRKPHLLSGCWQKAVCVFLGHGPSCHTLWASSKRGAWLPCLLRASDQRETRSKEAPIREAWSHTPIWIYSVHSIRGKSFRKSGHIQGKGVKHHLWKGQGMCAFPDSMSFLKPVRKWGHAIKCSVACSFTWHYTLMTSHVCMSYHFACHS